MMSHPSQVIPASREVVYAAFTDPAILVKWLPPGEMTGRMHEFDCGVGGGYRMSLFYPATAPAAIGKTSGHEDMVEVRFVELAPPERIVEAVRFVSADDAYRGEMTITIALSALGDATEVTMTFENLPPGVRPEDNDEGARQSLAQLAQFLMSNASSPPPFTGAARSEPASAAPATDPVAPHGRKS